MSPETQWQFPRIHTRITAVFLWRFTAQGALEARALLPGVIATDFVSSASSQSIGATVLVAAT
jgi:hypothetical protein